jgi:RNA polymerase sigma factor (TIGR02999 family)
MVGETISVTLLLKAWSGGNQEALRDLTSRVYPELRRIAAKYMRKERSGDSLQATALVHEAFLRLVEVDNVSWQDRAHFFAVAANMMRRILVDRARAKNMAKRGNVAVHVNFDDAPEIASDSRNREMVAIDDALNELAEIDPRKAKVIELRFFGGLSVRGNGGSIEDLSPKCDARLEDGQGVASDRTRSLIRYEPLIRSRRAASLASATSF